MNIKICWGICDGLAFVYFKDIPNVYLLTAECNTDFYEAWGYGMPEKAYKKITFTDRYSWASNTKHQARKTWSSLVDGSHFKKTVISSVSENVKSIMKQL